MDRETVVEIARAAGMMPTNFVGRWDTTDDELQRFAAEVERRTAEACAKVCQVIVDSGDYDGNQQYAAAGCREAIRAGKYKENLAQ